MAFARTVSTPAVSENHNRAVLGPFRQGRVVRGLHVFGQQADGTIPTSGHFSIYATPIFEGLRPPHNDFLLDRFITDRYFEGFAGYLRLPYYVDCYLPLQVVFDRAGSRDKEFWLVPGAKHNQALHVAGDAYRQRIREFFCSHFPAVPVESESAA